MPKEQQQSKFRTEKRQQMLGVKQKGQQKVAGGNTKSIHDNQSTEDDIILLRQISECAVPNRQNQTTKWRSVTCNRVSGKTKRVQTTTQVVQETKQKTINPYKIRMDMGF